MVKINFAHNVYDRHKTLKETIEIERKHFPNAEVLVACNYPKFPKSEFMKAFNGIRFITFDERTHKIGCANGFMWSLKLTNEFESDVIVFTHDDVRIYEEYIDIFYQNINDVEQGEHDVIVRKPKYNYGDNYYMMEGVFMSKRVVQEISKDFIMFTDEKQIPKDVRGSISPEVFLYNTLNAKNFNIKVIEYDNRKEEMYNDFLGETLGLYHKNIGKRGWKD